MADTFESIQNPLPLYRLIAEDPAQVEVVSTHNLPDFGQAEDHWAVLVKKDDAFYAGTVVAAEYKPAKGDQVTITVREGTFPTISQ